MSNTDHEETASVSSTHEPNRAHTSEDDLGLGELGELLAADDIDNRAQEARVFARMFGTEEHVRLGRWTLREPLGRGASGSVYAAHDPTLNRKVALKILKPLLDGDPEAARRRIMREAEALAQISHPNVVQVHDVKSEGDDVYLVMEYIDGSSLRKWQEAEHGLGEILDVYLQAAAGLACIHAAGLVHRDFKPENVLVHKNGRVVVIDLGLVRAVDEERVAVERLPEERESELERSITRTGARLGTLGYMAPEQLRGLDPDPRCDQFAFCVALYEAIAGVRPFADGDGTPAGRLACIERGDIQPPTGKARVPAWLAAVLRRGLSVDPDDRFSDMAALVRAIERRRRKRWPWIAGGLLVLALVMGVLLPVVQPAPSCKDVARSKRTELWDEARKQKLQRHLDAAGVPERAWRELTASLDERVEEWTEAHELQCEERRGAREHARSDLLQRHECLQRERWFFEELVEELSQTALPPERWGEVIEDAVQLLGERADCIAIERACAPPKEEIRAQLADAHRALDEAARFELLGEYDRAEQQIHRIIESAESVGYQPLRAEALYRLGHVLDHREEHYETAHRLMLEAADLATEHCHPDVEVDAWVYAIKMMVAGGPRSPRSAREYVQVARSALLRQDGLGVEHLDLVGDLTAYQALIASRKVESRYVRLAEYLEARGLIAQREAEYEEAIAWHERALAVREQLRPGAPWLLSKSHNNLGNALAEAERYGDAMRHYQRALELRLAVLGPRHHMVAQIHYNIGWIAMLQKDYERGRQELSQALDIRSEIHGPDSPELLGTLTALGQLEREAKQPERAAEIAARIASMHRRFREDGDAESRSMARIFEHSLLAAIYEDQGRLAEALQEMEWSIEILEAHDACEERGESGGDYAWALHDAGELAMALRRWPEALARLEQARSSYSRCSPPDEELEQSIEKNLAQVRRAAGRSP